MFVIWILVYGIAEPRQVGARNDTRFDSLIKYVKIGLNFGSTELTGLRSVMRRACSRMEVA